MSPPVKLGKSFLKAVFGPVYRYVRRLSYALFFRGLLAFSFLVAAVVRKVLLRQLYHDFQDLSVILVGGAPTAVMPANKIFEKHVAISSGCKTLTDQFSLHCDLSIMDGSFFNTEFSSRCPSKSAMHEKKAYADRVDNLIVVSSNGVKPDVAPESLIKSKSNYRVPIWLRAFIVNYVCGTNYLDNSGGYQYTQVGTGAWAAALLVFLEVKSVHVTGINLRTGTDSELTRYQHGVLAGVNNIEYPQSRCRNHSSPDTNVFCAIALRYRGRVTLTTNEGDIECAISPNLT